MKIRKISSSVALICSMLGCVNAANAADGGSFDIPLVIKYSTGDRCVPGTVPVQNVMLTRAELVAVPAPTIDKATYLKPNLVNVPMTNCSLGTKLKVSAGSSWLAAERGIPDLNEDGTFAATSNNGTVFDVLGSNGVLAIAPYARNGGGTLLRGVSTTGHETVISPADVLSMGYSVALRNTGTPRGIDSLTPDEYVATVAINVTMI